VPACNERRRTYLEVDAGLGKAAKAV